MKIREYEELRTIYLNLIHNKDVYDWSGIDTAVERLAHFLIEHSHDTV